MADTRPIGVFDSGIGGLTVVKELKKLLPNEDIVYFGDTARVPYGDRSEETIKKYAAEDAQILLKRGVKLIVAACGTVSAVAKDLKNTLAVPYFEVVSAASNYAAKVSKNGVIGVIGTDATIRSSAHKREILSCRKDAKVIEKACPLFVPLVESGWIDADDSVVRDTVKRYLSEIKQKGADTLILGCTHYPILRDAIMAELSCEVELVNMGVTVANQIKEYLEVNGIANGNKAEGCVEYIVSDKTDAFVSVGSTLLGKKIDPNLIKLVEVDL